MKRNKLNTIRNASIIAVGLVLGRGAQAANSLLGDTTLTFDGLGLANNTPIPTTFGSSNSVSGPGTVKGGSGLGQGTPDVSVNWISTSVAGRAGPVQFQYVNTGPWNAAEMNDSSAGLTQKIQLSAPPFAQITLNSFNFHPYYNNGLTFNYTVTVKDLTSSTTIFNNTTISLAADASKHLTTLGVSGSIGDTLELDITRTGGTGGPNDMAIDDLNFSETVPEPGTTALIAIGLGSVGLMARRRKR